MIENEKAYIFITPPDAIDSCYEVQIPANVLVDLWAGMIAAGLAVGCAGMLNKEFSAYANGPCNAAIAERAYSAANALLAERRNREKP